MNRRSFLSSILKAGVAAAVLPSALTYARKWKVLESGFQVPLWTSNRDLFAEERDGCDFGLVLQRNLVSLKNELDKSTGLRFLSFHYDDGSVTSELSYGIQRGFNETVLARFIRPPNE